MIEAKYRKKNKAKNDCSQQTRSAVTLGVHRNEHAGQEEELPDVFAKEVGVFLCPNRGGGDLEGLSSASKWPL